MKRLLAILFTLFVFCACERKQVGDIGEMPDSTQVVSSDTVAFMLSGFNSGVELLFLPDGTFSYSASHWSCLGGGHKRFVLGRYSRHENLIELNPENIKVLKYPREQLRLDSVNVMEYPFHQDSMDLNRRFYILEEDKRTYLLAPDEKSTWLFSKAEKEYFQSFDSEANNYDALSIDTLFFGEFVRDRLPKKYLKVFEQQMVLQE